MFTCIIGSLTALLFAAIVVRPVQRYNAAREETLFREALRAHRLTTIQKHYPEVSTLSWRELEQRYDVDSAYNQLH